MKARSLVQAFREKHDPHGYSTESLRDFGIEDVLKQLGSPSLFSQKRCIRCDGLLGSLKIAEIRLLAKRLQEDGDQTILLSVEEEPISDKIKEVFGEKSLVQYPFPLLSQDAFFRWCMEYVQQTVSPEKVKQIAQMCAGDTWRAVQELDKCMANPQAEIISVLMDEPGAFIAAEAFVRGQSWRIEAEKIEMEAFLATGLSQMRAAIRVRDGSVKGLHPFVVKKLSGLKQGQFEKKIRSLLRAQQQSRSGLGVAEEVITGVK